MSDRFQIIPRENAYGVIAGVDHGSKVRVMVRSPSHVLFNGFGGHIWTRGSEHHQSLKTLFRDRPTAARYDAAREKIDAAFGEGATDYVMRAWRDHQTILVDGGGEPLKLPNLERSAQMHAAYDAVKPDWEADLTGRQKTCLQCGGPLRPDTDHHRMGHAILPEHPRTVEDCQRLTNHPVIAVHGYGVNQHARYGLIAWFETWDGESYLDLDFCGDKCAATYGRRAAQELPLLEVGGQPVRRQHRIRDDVQHHEVEERTIAMADGSTIRI